LPPLLAALDTGATITQLSAGSRLLFSDGIDTKEWMPNNSVVNRFPATTGPIAHTLVDTRVSAATKNYKSINPTGAKAEAVVGTHTGPATAKRFFAMPLFKQAFIYNAKLYLINKADTRFIQYSEDYAYDLYRLGNNHIGSMFATLQAGAIPGVVLTTHAEGISVYSGMGPLGDGFTKKFYPCAPIDKTLYSGFVSKAYGYSHVFLCEDGVYVVGPDGVPHNVTVEQLTHLEKLNTSYTCATVDQNGKYLAFGNALCLEYDFRNKGLLTRALFGIAGACKWGKTDYFAAGQKIVTPGSAIDVTGSFSCSVTLPYSDLSAKGRKSIAALYFTGTLVGAVTITATDQTGVSWSREVVEDWVNVANCYIKVPKVFLGNHISFKIECTYGSFRLEELRAEIIASERSR